MLIILIALAAASLACFLPPLVLLHRRRGRPHLTRAEFRTRKRLADAAIWLKLVASLAGFAVWVAVSGRWLAAVPTLPLMIFLNRLGRRLGYLAAFYLDWDNWSRPKR